MTKAQDGGGHGGPFFPRARPALPCSSHIRWGAAAASRPWAMALPLRAVISRLRFFQSGALREIYLLCDETHALSRCSSSAAAWSRSTQPPSWRFCEYYRPVDTACPGPGPRCPLTTEPPHAGQISPSVHERRRRLFEPVRVDAQHGAGASSSSSAAISFFSRIGLFTLARLV